MIFVVDSSVALKWFVAEPRHEAAKQIILSGDKLVAPEFAYAEVTNALWRKARGGELTLIQVSAAIAELPQYLEFLSGGPGLMSLAFELAQNLEHSVYDCVFLALTLRFPEALLVTDDERFAGKAATQGYGDKLLTLSEDPIRLAFNERELVEIKRRYEISKATIEFVTTEVSRPFGATGLRVHNTGDLRPALESPAYVALKKDIANLSHHQAAVLLAIAWLGRGHDGGDFDRLYDQAATIANSPEQHAAYIISQIEYLDRGIAAYQQNQADRNKD